MLERTRKPHTDNVTLCATGPASRLADVEKALSGLGFSIQEAEDAIPWREVFNTPESEMPASMLRGARYREDMTQEELAKAAGIPRRHISEMENSKRPIGKQNARKLAEVLKVDYRVFL
ncbi:Helix-turn-helix [Desulfomicrobium apsheronum]|uniref:Helix-turn-helix n=1 Tax=Desulfomicrobium apsheronum TaxID=52560 RepID=A0A1I3SAN8_9BACT|nr:helix-turn-helix transcriptional regulator [Desulfomicrobium apsheronum]SFJ54576.1 Helix-turn-helix [Desulfomicrobium apsheronum]